MLANVPVQDFDRGADLREHLMSSVQKSGSKQGLCRVQRIGYPQERNTKLPQLKNSRDAQQRVEES